MKRLITALIVLTASLILTSTATADDAADVKAAVLKLTEALNSGDAEAIPEYLSVDSGFSYRGRLFSRWEGDVTVAWYKSLFDAGVKWNWSWRHLDVKVYGNAAVVTGYQEGNYTHSSGTIVQGTKRVSEFWIKQGGKWKRVHRHVSQLEPAQREVVSPQEATNGQ